ncbi:MAG: OmpA family protein [Deltaproteobacteria bacterium]|nr:OmpA family protein [Deltaproteobacteria bacterium]MBW2050839.1 OmpA family protein [Deltaproteobacteria bacterium]MBW2140063.1 OmpA family protein [Deltaproteobacteria bacterium]MBW2322071.1 OmpA family protein [Deltaproteobacteria bacterium]
MARKKEPEPPEWKKSNIGLMMTTSLMIILLAFFIMLSTMGVIDERREQIVFGSMIGSFGILPGGLSPTKTEGRSLTPPSSPLEIIQSDMEQMKDILAIKTVEDKINMLRGRTRRIISFQETVLFPPGGVEVLPEMKSVLMDFADVIRGSEYSIIIEGHTDDLPPQDETLISNWFVSATRAANILKIFIEEGGIDPTRLSAFGYAGYSPVVVNTSPENRRRNRRIDLILDTTRQAALWRYQKESWKLKPLTFKGFTFQLFRGKETP